METEGPRNVTIQKIADRLGISEPAIFKHFKGIDHIFEGLYQVCQQIYLALQDHLAVPFDRREKLFHFLPNWLKVFSMNAAFINLFQQSSEIFKAYTRFHQNLEQENDVLKANFLEHLRQAQQHEWIRTDLGLELLVRMLCGHLREELKLWRSATIPSESAKLAGQIQYSWEQLLALPEKA